MIDTRDIEQVENQSFGRKKRNSVCLESKGPLITCSNDSLPRINSFYGISQGLTTKTRRFSDSKKGNHLGDLQSPLEALTMDYMTSTEFPRKKTFVHGAKPRKTRRSSMTMPKTSWPELDNDIKPERLGLPMLNISLPPVTLPFDEINFSAADGQQQHYNFEGLGHHPIECEEKNQDYGRYYLDDPNLMSAKALQNSLVHIEPEEKCKLSRKGPWSKEEDELLIKYASGLKTRNWTEIAERIPGRTAKQCRERWTFNLDPSINKDTWKLDEDMLLIRKQSILGNKWAQIAQLLPGRTENAVKTRFKSILRAKKREWKPEEDMRLLELYQSEGGNWETIASCLPSHRTKHAVKIRFKELQLGLDKVKPCEKGNARQTVRLMFYPQETIVQVSEYYKSLANGETKLSQTRENQYQNYEQVFRQVEVGEGCADIEKDQAVLSGFEELFSMNNIIA